VNPTKKEITAVVELLEQDWETPEELAKAVIAAVDDARVERTTYVAVLQFGKAKPVWYAGLGPYAGATSARNAAKRFPGSSVATVIAVVPLRSPEMVEQQLRETA